LILAQARYDKELESPYQGAEQTLRALSSRYRIGVIANQPAGTEERLTKWGLMPFISVCFSSTEVGLEKPDPAIFELALSQSGCEPEQAVMIGDRIDNDIRPARLLSWKTIRIAQGFARFQSPRDGLDEADITLANVKLVQFSRAVWRNQADCPQELSPCFTARRRITGFWRHILKTERGVAEPNSGSSRFSTGN
jgi:HAD superfamily hydrolase (TIGR01509 family)